MKTLLQVLKSERITTPHLPLLTSSCSYGDLSDTCQCFGVLTGRHTWKSSYCCTGSTSALSMSLNLSARQRLQHLSPPCPWHAQWYLHDLGVTLLNMCIEYYVSVQNHHLICAATQLGNPCNMQTPLSRCNFHSLLDAGKNNATVSAYVCWESYNTTDCITNAKDPMHEVHNWITAGITCHLKQIMAPRDSPTNSQM